jgi:two-component system OmpR family response regulator
MPELDGLEACRRIRAASAVPILFLSSRGEELDRVLGLELGGDDYLTKPFSPRELVSRIRAIFRRVRPAAPERPTEGSVRTDAATFRAYVGETVLDLTATEFRLLHALVGAPGRVFSRDDLVVHAYPDERFVADRTVDSHMRRIRAKLRMAGAGEPIETVHGVGFRLVRP